MRILQTHLPPQGIAFRHRFQSHQFGFAAFGIVCARHTGKAQGGIGFEAKFLGLFLKIFGCGFVTDDHSITAQELFGVSP